MNPLIKHRLEDYIAAPNRDPKQPDTWTFTEQVKTLRPDFYTKVVPHHLLFNLEYSIICQQLTRNFDTTDAKNSPHLLEQVEAALILSEILEQIYLHYLVVPREVDRLRKHQEVYKQILATGKHYYFPISLETDPVDVGLSLSQHIRTSIGNNNWYRLLLVRVKRLLNVIDMIGTGSHVYGSFVVYMDQMLNPYLPYLAWGFLLPRLLMNLALTIKHTVPGFWMLDKEASLGWEVRMEAQMQRRWFELGNDSVSVFVGLINCYILTGILAHTVAYISIGLFSYDVVWASLRAYIELGRLYDLQKEYADLIANTKDFEDIQFLFDLQKHVAERINFDEQRFAINVATMVVLLLSMCMFIPSIAVSPLIPLAGAITLVGSTLVSYGMTVELEKERPKEDVVTSGLAALSFFAPPKPTKSTDDHLDFSSASLATDAFSMKS